jgi:hypothetical protein
MSSLSLRRSQPLVRTHTHPRHQGSKRDPYATWAVGSSP